MNNFFIGKVRDLQNRIPPSDCDPLKHVKKLMKNRKCKFELRSLYPSEVEKIIMNLKSTHSCGTDNIDSYILKLACQELLPVITHIINISIKQKLFPSPWKTAKVIPLHKKDERTEPKNYRPVALLAITSKILERAIFNQLIEYLETNDLLHPSHHGFRKNHSTASALLQMNHSWIEALEDKEITAVIMLDMSAAFDLVDSSLLIQKLKYYGLQDCATSWLTSYLTDRQQCVYVDGTFSKYLPVEVGVPQGSILGPLLYILFSNDLPEAIHDHLPEHDQGFFNIHCHSCGGMCCFADDSTYSASSQNPGELKIKIDEKYKEISRYMASNRLVLNGDKTHLLVMASERQHLVNGNFGISLDTGDEVILPVDCEKLLGAL